MKGSQNASRGHQIRHIFQPFFHVICINFQQKVETKFNKLENKTHLVGTK
jgi:hypothetical protein